MNHSTSLIFKIATERWELDEIRRLNYRTFVEEIPQHAPNAETRLVDRFDRENTYLICLREQRLIGMVALRGQRPFSLDEKIKELNAFLPQGKKACEIRLLAVEKTSRSGRVLWGLLRLLGEVCS